MKRPWAAELAVSAEHARALIEAQFPDLAPARIEALGAGWDNSAFLVNGAYVFRFPRREIAAELIETETRVLPAIAPRLPLAIPVPVMIGRPDAQYPWPFSGYAVLAGRAAACADLDDAQREAAAPALAAFLRALHRIPRDVAERAGAPPDRIRRLDVAYRAERSLEWIEAAEALGLVRDGGGLRAIIAAAPRAWTPRTDVLVHGDLDSRHVLVDEGARPCGVIDWGDVHRGDPAVDLAIAPGFLPPQGQAAFLAHYGPVDEDAWAVGRLRAVHAGLTVVLWAHDIGDDDLRREGAVWLRNAVAAVAE